MGICMQFSWNFCFLESFTLWPFFGIVLCFHGVDSEIREHSAVVFCVLRAAVSDL